MGEPIRIQKLLAGWGVGPRRGIERLIEIGAVSIDGKTLTTHGFTVDPDNLPVIAVNGKVVKPPAQTEFSIYIFNKPEWVITTLKDELGRKSIGDYLPAGKRLYPIGRLDSDSTGILLITDHGELTNRLLHPSYKVEKEYVIKIAGGLLNQAEEEQFCSGLNLEDGLTAPCSLKKMREPQTYSVTIREGKKRQVRRMFESLDRKVISLQRIRFGPLKIGNLKPGELRLLNPEEKAALLEAAGLRE